MEVKTLVLVIGHTTTHCNEALQAEYDNGFRVKTTTALNESLVFVVLEKEKQPESA